MKLKECLEKYGIEINHVNDVVANSSVEDRRLIVSTFSVLAYIAIKNVLDEMLETNSLIDFSRPNTRLVSIDFNSNSREVLTFEIQTKYFKKINSLSENQYELKRLEEKLKEKILGFYQAVSEPSQQLKEYMDSVLCDNEVCLISGNTSGFLNAVNHVQRHEEEFVEAPSVLDSPKYALISKK